MKKLFLILTIFIGAFMFYACSKQEPVANFIPTPTPLAQNEDHEEKLNGDDSQTEGTLDGGPAYQGPTTTKYVELTTNDGILNIRNSPSTGEVVGFLVHMEKVEVIDIVDGWASFVYQDEICYVSEGFLVDEKPDYINP